MSKEIQNTGLKKLASFCPQISCKTKTQSWLARMHFLSRCVSCMNCFEFWLVHWVFCVRLDWLEWLLWLWIYKNHFKTTVYALWVCLLGTYLVSFFLESHSKWFEPRSISSSHYVIVWVRVVLKRTVVGDGRFDNLSGSHLHSQLNSVCQSMMFLVRWKRLAS